MMRTAPPSRALRIATALAAVVSLVAVVGRAMPEVGFTRIVAGVAILVFVVVTAMTMQSKVRSTSMKSRITKRIGGCKLCGLDPSIDDSDEPATKGRCIECGRAKSG